MEEQALIRVSQLPVIEERLRALKEEWEQKASDAATMVCTEETVQTIKKMRADMRKEYEEAEAQRKAAKAAYMAPWARIEDAFKDCIADAYKRADKTYKEKVADVEDAQKAEAEKQCREYFQELCAVHGLPWLQYELAGVKITLTEAKKQTPSKCFDALSEFVARVAVDVDGISQMDGGPEIMAEYKENGLNLTRALKTVQSRHEAEQAEREAAVEYKERRERVAESVSRVEAAAPPVLVKAEKEVETEDVLTVTFTATAARTKLIALREYLKKEGIMYE